MANSRRSISDQWARAREAPILDIAERLGIQVRRNKAECFANHDKKTPSLTFSPQKGLWNCFGCGKGGTTIDLVASVHECSPKEAMEWILGLSRTSQIGLSVRKPLGNPKDIKAPLYVPDPEVYKNIHELSPLGSSGEKYLIDRGFTIETIEHFRIGQIQDPVRLRQHLLKRFGADRLEKCGVLKRGDSGISSENLRLVWWDDTLVFPFYQSDSIVYLQGRRLKGNEPRYLGLAEISKPLFHFDAIGEYSSSVASSQKLYICEGIPDTMAAHQLGWRAIGVLGAHSFRAEWASQLLSFQIVVVPDADRAGMQFYKKISSAFSKYGKAVEGILLKPGTDLADSLRSKTK